MIQFRVLSGKQAGSSWSARRFPFWIGRASDSVFPLNDEGVWDYHAEIRLDPKAGIAIRSGAEALLIVNDQAIREILLRNGDLIDLGGVRLQFFLAPVRQRKLRWMEWLVWTSLALIIAAELFLIYWLPG